MMVYLFLATDIKFGAVAKGQTAALRVDGSIPARNKYFYGLR